MSLEKLCEGYGLIEGPIWVPGRGLLFSDVIHGGVFCLDASGDVSTVFEHRRGIGGMSLHADDGVLVSGRNIAFKPFGDGETRMVLDRDEENGLVGYNDITTDAVGRVYAGSLGSSPVFEDGRGPASGDLYLIDLDGTARKVGEDVRLTNGLGFSPDGRTLYHSDSARQSMMKYEVFDDGSLGEKTLFVRVEKGAPDGLVVASDGSVWAALAGGGAGVDVFSADGQKIDHIAIPQPMCTSVCFGGDDLKDLYIVSGSDGMDTDRGGAVYRYRCNVAGLEVHPARVQI